MKFISTNHNLTPVSLIEAVERCVAPDGGLFMPEFIPEIPKAFFNNIGEMNLRDIAFVVASSFIGEEINPSKLKLIVDEAFNFKAPLVKIAKNTYALELFHGPTLSFKDFGARFMARIMKYADGLKNSAKQRKVLVATTGNSGAAAANGLLNIDGVSVYVLYPKGVMTRLQQRQLTALGGNVYPLEILGSIDDCKTLVKNAIACQNNEHVNLTGANSINIARLIPQVTFAFHAYAQLKALEIADANEAAYSIPCGNLSNLIAAVIAKRAGLPTGPIVAACNNNNSLKNIIDGNVNNNTPIKTLAPSMDMILPSGLPRLLHLYDGKITNITNDIIIPQGISDQQIAETVKKLRTSSNYTIDPHGAVALAASASIEDSRTKVVFATGHPAKQLDIMTGITGTPIELPVQLNRFMTNAVHPTIMPPTMPALKKHLNLS